MRSMWIVATEHNLSTVVGNTLFILISFIILLALLKKYALGPLLSMMEKRESQVNSDLDKAAKMKAEAEADEKQAKEAVKDAQTHAQNLVTKAKDAGERIKNEASEKARLNVIHIRQEAEKAIEIERQQTMTELKLHVTDMSIELAQKLLKREITPEDHNKLIDDFIEGLEK